LVHAYDTPYRLRLADEPHRGLAATRNAGARHAQNPIVVFLDDDIVPEPGFLSAHAAAHRDSPDDHVALGHYPPATREGGLWALSVRNWWEDYFRRKAEPGHVWTFMDLSDGNSSMRTELLFSHGGFDEDFPEGRRQDWELGQRLLGRGVRLGHYADAFGWHQFDPRFHTGITNPRIEAHGDVLLARKHPLLKHRLRLAQVARGFAAQRRSYTATFRDPERAMHAVRALIPVADAMEALRMRGRWLRLVNAMLTAGYVAGLADVMTFEELEAFLEPVHREEGVAHGVVDLSAPERLRLGPDAAANLSIRCGDLELAALRPLGVEAQWDWREVAERVAEAVDSEAATDLLERPERCPGILPAALAQSAAPGGGRLASAR
jgi:hypothetical protein